MLDNIKYLMCFKSVDKYIADKNYELALEKLNFLISEEYQPAETFLKRGQLCHTLLMNEEAYSDFTYIIKHCAKKDAAYLERMCLNYEINNYIEAIADSYKVLETDNQNTDAVRIIFLSLCLSGNLSQARDFILKYMNYHMYKALQFIFNEIAVLIAQDDYSKALKLLEVIDDIDSDNPIKLLKEANIYKLAGEIEKSDYILKRLDSAFPKYFISHFRFTDMYEERDLLEICFLLELEIFDKQKLFTYPLKILEGYKKHLEGHIIESKECFESAIKLNPTKPEAYVLLAQTLQLMSGYDNPEYKKDAEENYKIAMEIYKKQRLEDKAEAMKRQLKHLNSSLVFK